MELNNVKMDKTKSLRHVSYNYKVMSFPLICACFKYQKKHQVVTPMK